MITQGFTVYSIVHFYFIKYSFITGTKTCGHSPHSHPKMFAMLCDDLTHLHETLRG